MREETCAKYVKLGVEIDDDLSWRTHIDKVMRRIGKLAVIKRAGTYLPYHIRKMLHVYISEAFLLPHLDYCSDSGLDSLWCNTKKSAGKTMLSWVTPH